VLEVEIEADGHVGRGESAPVHYRGETLHSMAKSVETVRGAIEDGADREWLLAHMQIGGARNALDCALWDLEAQRSGQPAWQRAGLECPRPVRTTFTIGAGAPREMAAKALAFREAHALKLKLTGSGTDAECVEAVRAVRDDAEICIDANQGFTLPQFRELLPVLLEARVSLVEQPFPIGREALLDGLGSPIPIAADESAQGLGDLSALVGRFDVVNIKLEKCGGLTEALAMLDTSRVLGLGVMVGTMGGSSLAMAPAWLVGQRCDLVDLDTPALLASDRVPSVRYVDGAIDCPNTIWGVRRSAHDEIVPGAGEGEG
jgi:L-alanine-DL-glutamate epimerase-like enolase superfamily enzyme